MKHASSLLCATLLLGAPLADAATITVTSLNDSGAGSLRAAIAQANATPEADTIQFQAGLQGTIDLTGGELVVTENLGIVGPGAGKVTIDAGDRSRVFRLNNPQGLDRTWSISGLTIKRGAAAVAADGGDNGGGLFYESPAWASIRPTLKLSDMNFIANKSLSDGGGISVSGANLSLINVTASDNHAAGGFQPKGGAVHLARGQLRMDRTRIIDNTAELAGGGINLSPPGISAVITDSLVQGNQATLAGGGMNATTMVNLTISRSAFVGNAVTSQTEGGGLYFSSVTDAGSAENVIENSTFSGNRTQHQFSHGAGVAVAQGNLTVRNSTFAHNATSPDTSPGQGAGGALWVGTGATTRVTVQSTLFNRNTHGNTSQPIDVTRSVTGVPQTEGTLNVDHSLFLVMPAIGTITNASANIEADAKLQDLTLAHGGVTPVHPIPADSPAIDKGSNPANLATDQRGAGFVRTIDFNPCRRPNVHVTDIGAYEYRADTIFCYGFEN